MANEQRVQVKFTLSEELNLPEDLFHVIGFEGMEAISEPFRFDIEVISNDPKIDLQNIVGKNATLEISRHENTRKIHGVVSCFEQAEETQFDQYSYKFVLVPRLWLMGLSRQNQIYQETPVPDIVSEEILDSEYPGGMVGDDLEFRLSNTYPASEYVVQYRETDLDFVSRLLEHEGIYYYFDHEKDRDCMVFCDDKSNLDAVKAENKLSYVPASGLASFEEEAIHSFRVKQVQISKDILLKDFNYRKPHLPLQVEAQTSEVGHGRLSHYGEHFKDPEQGANLANLRAQLEICKQKTCLGVSDAIALEAGKLFEQIDHYRDDLDGEYLVTRIYHRGGQALPGVSGASQSKEAIAYANEFEALPADVEFRPALKTNKPKLYGIMSATIDGAQDNNRAQIDELGRYKLVMPFDVSGKAVGKASRWVRKAESYGGQGTGMHFPLLKGTEVIWTCIDGDLDRPIITGVVANAKNKSVVDSTNATRNTVKTASGIQMVLDDGGPTGSGASVGGQQQQTKLQENQPLSAEMAPVKGSNGLVQQQQQNVMTEREATDTDGTNATTGAANADTDGLAPGEKMYSMLVDNYDGGGKSSYFRMGVADRHSVTEEGTYSDNSWAGMSNSWIKSIKGTSSSLPGIFLGTDGVYTQKAGKAFLSKTEGIAFSHTIGAKGDFSFAYKTTVDIGLSSTVKLAASFSASASITTDVKYGNDFSYTAGKKFTKTKVSEFKDVDGPIVTNGQEFVWRATKINPADVGRTKAMLAVGAASFAAAGAGSGSVWGGTDLTEKIATASLAGSALATLTAIHSTHSFGKKVIAEEKKATAAKVGTESIITMDEDSILLSCDGTSVIINGQGVFINGKTLAIGNLPDDSAQFTPFENNKDADLKKIKVSQVHPEYVYVNATKRVDVRSQQSIFLTSNKDLKMEDGPEPGDHDVKTKTLRIERVPKDKGASIALATDESTKKPLLKCFSDDWIALKSSDKIDAKGKNIKIKAETKATLLGGAAEVGASSGGAETIKGKVNFTK